MTRRVHVGNLSYTTDESNLQRLFAPFGTVRGAEILSDRVAAARSIGLALVEMCSDEEAEAAIAALDGSLFCGRTLEVGWDLPALPPAAPALPPLDPLDVPEGSDPRASWGPGGTSFEMDEAIGEAKARRRRRDAAG